MAINDLDPNVVLVDTCYPGHAGFDAITEVTVIGPDFDPNGARGFLAPTVLGFSAQPMQAYDVDNGGPPRAVLYLGGNADLYVLVDPCDEGRVDMVSVGSQRLVVIDEITCTAGSGS